MKLTLRWLVISRWDSPRALTNPRAGEVVLKRYLRWRQVTLLLVIVLTALTAGIDTWSKEPGGPEHKPFNFVLRLDPTEGPVEQTWFGDLGDLLWLLSFYSLPAAALVALCCATRPRVSRAVLLAGWCASFLVPVAIALTPWNWWTVEPPPPTTTAARLVRQYERLTEGLVWANYYLFVLSPAVLALVPGLLRACVRVKRLLPESSLPGSFLVAAVPFNGFLVLVTVVALAQVAPSPLLVVGMLLWVAAPFAYLLRARDFVRPLSTASEVRGLAYAQMLAWVLFVASSVCLLAYAVSWEMFGLRLVGSDPRTSLLRPLQVVRYVLDFSGRSSYITLLGADLLLWATLVAWRQRREFWRSERAENSMRIMERLEAALVRRAAVSPPAAPGS